MVVENKLFATAYTKEINKEERTIVAWASKAIIDRDKEIIKGNAWDLKAYRKHPIIILSHNYRDLTKSWIGKTLWIKPSEEGLLFKAQLATTEAAREAFQIVQDTGIAAFSVGFIPKKWNDKMVKDMNDEELEMIKGAGLKDEDKVRIYTKCELLEISLVSVPSCSTATLTAYNEGKIKTKELQEEIKETMELEITDEPDEVELTEEGKKKMEEALEDIKAGRIEKVDIDKLEKELADEKKEVVLKPEETDDYIRIPVRDCKVTATITISVDQGITALYCGKIKKIRTYIFAKAKGWTMAKAQAWVKENSKEYDDIDIKDYEIESEEKGVIPFKATLKAPEGEAWDAGAEVKKASGNATKLNLMHTWVDSGADDFDADEGQWYKLSHHKGDGAQAVVWKGVIAAMSTILGARGGIRLPAGDRKGCHSHLVGHYKQFDKDPPQFKDYSEAELKELFPEEEPSKSPNFNEVYEVVQENIELRKLLVECNKKLDEETLGFFELRNLDEFKKMKVLLKAGAVLNRKNKADLTKIKELAQNVLDSAETAEPAEEGKEVGGLEIEESAELEIKEDGKKEEEPTEEKEETIDISADEIKVIVNEALDEQADKVGEKVKEIVNDNFRRLTGKVI